MATKKKNRGTAMSARSPRPRNAPVFVVPMAARVVRTLPESDDWIYELKWDGYRALLLKDGDAVEIRSRNDRDLTGTYPSIVGAVQRIKSERATIDGEIVALDAKGRPSFQVLQHLGSNPGHSIAFYAFDLLHLNGSDLTGRPLTDRRSQLQR